MSRVSQMARTVLRWPPAAIAQWMRMVERTAVSSSTPPAQRTEVVTLLHARHQVRGRLLRDGMTVLAPSHRRPRDALVSTKSGRRDRG